MRMNEVELTADLFIAFIDGIQNRKIVKNYYKKYDDNFDEREMLEERFDEVVSLITRIFGDNLKKSKYKKPALFFAMFLALYNIKYDINNIDNMQHIEGPLSDKEISKIKTCLDRIEEIINSEDLSKEQLEFVTSISRATSDAESRKIRTKFIVNEIGKALSE